MMMKKLYRPPPLAETATATEQNKTETETETETNTSKWHEKKTEQTNKKIK